MATDVQIFGDVIGLFDAAPGSVYLPDLTGAIANGGSELQLARDLAANPLFTNNIMGAATTPGAQVQKLMGNFGFTYSSSPVAGTASGDAQAWFAAQIAAHLGFGDIVYYAVASLTNTAWVAANPEFSSAAQALDNKIAISNYYSSNIAGNATALPDLQAVLSAVNSSTPVSTASDMVAAINAGEAASHVTLGPLAPNPVQVSGTPAMTVSDSGSGTVSFSAGGQAATITGTAGDSINIGAGASTGAVNTTILGAHSVGDNISVSVGSGGSSTLFGEIGSDNISIGYGAGPTGTVDLSQGHTGTNVTIGGMDSSSTYAAAPNVTTLNNSAGDTIKMTTGANLSLTNSGGGDTILLGGLGFVKVGLGAHTAPDLLDMTPVLTPTLLPGYSQEGTFSTVVSGFNINTDSLKMTTTTPGVAETIHGSGFTIDISSAGIATFSVLPGPGISPLQMVWQSIMNDPTQYNHLIYYTDGQNGYVIDQRVITNSSFIELTGVTNVQGFSTTPQANMIHVV